MTKERSEIRKLVKEELEVQIHGQFIGGEYRFLIFFEDGTSVSNLDYFRNKALVKSKKISQMKLDEDWFKNEGLVSSIKVSGSIIQMSNRSNDSYESRLIQRISDNQKKLEMTRDTLNAINLLNGLERHLLIAHGIMDIDFESISKVFRIKPETLRRQYLVSLYDLALIKGLVVM